LLRTESMSLFGHYDPLIVMSVVHLIAVHNVATAEARPWLIAGRSAVA
jgi:hypothetical protein